MYKILISLILWPIWFVYTFFVLILIFFLIFIIPRKIFYFFLRPFCWFWCFFGGQILKKDNMPPSASEQPYIYMFNHTSMFDQFMIGAFVNHYITAVAAIEVFRYPLWGQVCRRYGIIPIPRTRIKQALKSLVRAQDKISKGSSIIIAPEGTRTLNGEIGLFKKGPFHLAKNSGATIIPIGLIGGFKAKKKSDWKLRPGILRIRFGAPIYSKEYSDLTIEELRDSVRKRIKDLIKEKD